MEQVKKCGKCDSQGLRYQEDIWGGYQNCINCGWEDMVWQVSEDKEDSLVGWQNHTEQRSGIAVHSATMSGAIPLELRKKLGAQTAGVLIETPNKA